MEDKPIDLTPVAGIVSAYVHDYESNLIAILQQTQDEYGYLPKSVMKEITKLTDVPLTRIFGVVTFYSQFTLTPRGKHAIKICNGTACHVRGVDEVKEKVKEHLSVTEGETTADFQFTLETVACIGTCFLAPVMMVDDRYFGKLTTDSVTDIVKEYSN
ncbi:MAG: NADH-quinone oxidoreductase subunit NuoE [Candidatus Scalindua sp.]|nr:NADH-quinone oxidoreductase subunit NuoE [Candidatus Scalindua sp.]MBT5307004.1 NADH-quinone oxidoreductase subunit NuoE [Candidatus Scalindua sp.]MBT6050765.1 NADH-quinone oxidoreductase subunit NuoE [Candidatus Scalindua sp.]MBT6225127.1 NADH-quinone oxidoreductase subunit NuoE [Candidatus Scalindua sp.]MBT6561797.1 NADH-quinone oxidoreductase subunit NuoE [Candidatus Scalindua sp.]